MEKAGWPDCDQTEALRGSGGGFQEKKEMSVSAEQGQDLSTSWDA